MRCPFCNMTRTVRVPDKNFPVVAEAIAMRFGISPSQVDPMAHLVTVPAPLYQRSYAGEPEYISPRCYWCYVKAEKRLEVL